MKFSAIKPLLFIYITILLTIMSCATRQDIAYFQDEKIGEFTQPNLFYNLIYQPSDILTIDVTAFDPETVRAFNLNVVPYDIDSSTFDARTNLRMQTYIVDANGFINFPVLGKIKIADLSRQEATELLTLKISEYAKDPLVNIRLTNFTITVLGEVNNPGSFIIQDEKVTLTEALGLAGDLTIYGKRNNVLLIREINGIKKFSILDLTSVKALTSSTFNLKQNDVIYVEPNNSRVRTSSFNENNIVIISAVSTLATILAIFMTRN